MCSEIEFVSTADALRGGCVEREVGGVDHRGALLGPEESGLEPGRVLGLFLLGSLLDRFAGWVGGWGRLSPNCWWVHLMGVLFPWMVFLSGVWWFGVGFLPVF
jgi:hypothetical protein